jgi:hypothetical protein
MRTAAVLVFIAQFLFARPSHADDAPDLRAHGPQAPDDRFPSHVFRLRAHEPDRVQLAFDYGLTQPILLHGFNAAVDVRYRRLIVTYSHGQGMDYTTFENAVDRSAGAKVSLPYSTGGGVGVLLIDELWVLADWKVHHFEINTPADHPSYTTVTVGAEVGWRFFLWKGFNVALVARYWPNVWSSSGAGVTIHNTQGKLVLDPPEQQGVGGLLGNVLVGWAFDL